MNRVRPHQSSASRSVVKSARISSTRVCEAGHNSVPMEGDSGETLSSPNPSTELHWAVEQGGGRLGNRQPYPEE